MLLLVQTIVIWFIHLLSSLQDNADKSSSTDVLCQAMESIMITSNDTSLYVLSQTETSSSELSGDSRSSSNLSLRRTKLNEFLAISGKSTLTQQWKPWANLLGRTRHVYINKARDAVAAAWKWLFQMTLVACGEHWKSLVKLRVLWVYCLNPILLMTNIWSR